ncbi:UNVERIFIED_CONTAM: hypothetical protein H355_011802 [Colinus virginianus]|nr:hypothetical protein H355_011802 [Colinus virginianus]
MVLCDVAKGCSDDILDEATRHHLFTDTFCRVCWVVLPFESQRMSHYEGKRHARNVYLYVQMHGRMDERMRHDKKKEIMDCANFQMDGTRIVENNYCNLCNMILISPVVASSHLQGKIHAKKLRQLAEKKALMEAQSVQPVAVPSETEVPSTSLTASLDVSYCNLCCVPFSNVLSAQQHYAGKKHRRNVARKKLMEELGIKPVPRESRTNGSFFSAIGFGRYTCPVCNVVLITIDEYQSHMQGKKHKTSLCRAMKIHRVTKCSKKTYYSLQGHKATCLEERMDLRIAEEFQEVKPSSSKCEQNQHSSFFSETQAPANTGKETLPSCSSARECALENTASCQRGTARCVEGQASGGPAVVDESFGLSAVESKEYCKLVLAETFSISYREEQSLQIKYTEEKKYVSEEFECKKEDSALKRKEDGEGSHLENENEKQKRIKLDVASVDEKKPRCYKGGRRKRRPAKKQKQSKRCTTEKKMPQIKVKTENELL